MRIPPSFLDSVASSIDYDLQFANATKNAGNVITAFLCGTRMISVNWSENSRQTDIGAMVKITQQQRLFQIA